MCEIHGPQDLPETGVEFVDVVVLCEHPGDLFTNVQLKVFQPFISDLGSGFFEEGEHV